MFTSVFTTPSYQAILFLFAATLLLLILVLAYLLTSHNALSKSKKESSIHREKMVSCESELQSVRTQAKEIEQRNEFLERDNRRLTPFANMPDAINQARKRVTEADNYFLKTTQDANNIINQAKADSDILIAQSRQQIREQYEVANVVLQQARERANSILTEATLRAEQIAGDAWDAKDRQVFYQRTSLAMQNKVKGYGDEYLIPNEALINEWSEQYSHEQAGRNLKRVSDQIKSMIREGAAADCDYTDSLRRQRAIAFVLDAFNGKADSIFARVDTDNFGKLHAELEDAFDLVNYNGRSFKNARILPDYADLVEAQLKYAIQINELKKRDKEEQRRIKAQMSEQRQAKKELKKLKRQSLKEPKRLLKEIKQIESKMASSSDVQKQEYQVQLAELMEKLSHAEAQNRRAESMAKLPKQGYVYVVSNVGSFGENILKIGMTHRLEPEDKINELRDESVPFGFDVHAIIHSEDAPMLEAYLHNKFRSKRVNRLNLKAGFFDIALGEVRAEIESLNLHCQWTMKAAAQEFRESAQIQKFAEKEYVHYAEVLEIG